MNERRNLNHAHQRHHCRNVLFGILLFYPSLRLVWSVPVRKEANKIPDTKSLKRRFNVWYDIIQNYLSY